MNKYIRRIVESIFDDEDFDNYEDQQVDDIIRNNVEKNGKNVIEGFLKDFFFGHYIKYGAGFFKNAPNRFDFIIEGQTITFLRPGTKSFVITFYHGEDFIEFLNLIHSLGFNKINNTIYIDHLNAKNLYSLEGNIPNVYIEGVGVSYLDKININEINAHKLSLRVKSGSNINIDNVNVSILEVLGNIPAFDKAYIHNCNAKKLYYQYMPNIYKSENTNGTIPDSIKTFVCDFSSYNKENIYNININLNKNLKSLYLSYKFAKQNKIHYTLNNNDCIDLNTYKMLKQLTLTSKSFYNNGKFTKEHKYVFTTMDDYNKYKNIIETRDNNI